MAGTEADKNQEDVTAQLSDQLRQELSNAYAFVRGQEVADSFLAITFEEVLDQQISRIEDPGTDIRPNVIDRITKIKENILAAVETITAMPEDFFKKYEASEDAVTDPTPEDPLDKLYTA
jgi:hypothetical protein